MTVPLISLSGPSTKSRSHSPRVDDYDSSSSTDSNETARNSPQYRASLPTAFLSSQTNTQGNLMPPDYLFSLPPLSGRPSTPSSGSATPVPSRSVSPLPQFYASAPGSSCSSDDDEPTSPLLHTSPTLGWREGRRQWWSFGSRARRRRRRDAGFVRTTKKYMRRIFRHPLFPKQPLTIVLTLLIFALFAVCLTFLIIHILNPDKEPLPWRAYCTLPRTSSTPPETTASVYDTFEIPSNSGPMPPSFPPAHLDMLPPAGLFVGVFSMDSAIERRMLIRNSWANHPRSRNGAGVGDNGDGTSRTLVRFILGQPSKIWKRRIKLEMELYNDIVILPISENMNAGKSHAYFTWAAENAWVPPYYFNTTVSPPEFSYSKQTAPARFLAQHDPNLAWINQHVGNAAEWTRPDFVVKVDDDSFVMLAELESRLRVELHAKTNPIEADYAWPATSTPVAPPLDVNASAPDASAALPSGLQEDPLVYWGYLVKQRFMAGELYALSWRLVDWVSKDTTVKTLTKGAEDKQTAKWMRVHPRRDEIRWASDRCWVYDHPRAGTVYSHGFLYPSEVTRVKRGIIQYFDGQLQNAINTPVASLSSRVLFGGNDIPTPAAWAHSSVSTFGIRYTSPISNMTTWQSVEALIEGSDMSQLREGSAMTPEYAWHHREGRHRRYENKRVGGTVVVHFIKKHMWFLETAMAMLEGDEYSESEKAYTGHNKFGWHRTLATVSRLIALRG